MYLFNRFLIIKMKICYFEELEIGLTSEPSLWGELGGARTSEYLSFVHQSAAARRVCCLHVKGCVGFTTGPLLSIINRF